MRRGWRRRRRGGRSTWRGGRCCGPRCCGWASEEHVAAAGRCTTSSRDGWSTGRAACGRWRRCYEAFPRRAGASPLPELPVQYADFAAVAAAVAAGRGAGGAARVLAASSWRGAGGAGAADGPAAAGGADVQRERQPRACLGAELLGAACRAWRARRGRRSSWCCWPAFQALLWPLRGAGRRCRGHADRGPARGRRRKALIGFFVNTLVLRAELAGDPSVRAAAGAGAGGGAGGLRAPGRAVRAAGRGAAAGARAWPRRRCSR